MADCEKSLKEARRNCLELKEKNRKLSSELETARNMLKSNESDKDAELQRLRMGYAELKREFNLATEGNMMRRNSANVQSQDLDPLKATLSEHENSISLLELQRENEFLK